MPRRKTVLIRPFPAIRSGRWHAVRAVSVELDRGRVLHVVVEHTDAAQAGRRHAFDLPLPKPDGASARFFRAAGVDVEAGGRIDLKDVVGRSLRVRFGVRAAGGDIVPIDFSPVENQGEQE